LKLQRQAGCSSPSGNTAELSVSLTAGSGRSVRVEKQPYFIYRKDRQPIFMAAICSVPFELGDKAEEFLIVIAPRIKS
jgi:putative SOS response-associated peptidase YedK